MKPSQRNDVAALTFGALVAGGLWWILPMLHWVVYLVVGLMMMGFFSMAGAIGGGASKAMDRE